MEKQMYVPTLNGQIYPITNTAAETKEEAITLMRQLVMQRMNALLGGIHSAWTRVPNGSVRELDYLRSVQVDAASFVIQNDGGNVTIRPISAEIPAANGPSSVGAEAA